MKLLKGIGWSVTGLFGLALLVLVVALMINWNDRPPSQAALRLRDLIDERPPVPDADNAYVYALGFLADASDDPQQAGSRRLAWIEAFEFGDDTSEDPAVEYEDFESSSYEGQLELRKICQEANGGKCRNSFDRLVVEAGLTAGDRQYLARYRELLKRRAWREAALSDFRLPVPPLSHVLHGQRLLMLDLRLRARAGAASEIRAELDADHMFWRGVLANSDQLLTKMISVAALRQNFYFGNLVVRSLPLVEQLNALPDGWKRQFTGEEIALHRAMAGEMRLAETLMRGLLEPVQWDSLRDVPSREPSWGREFVRGVMSDFYQPQDLINSTADYYLSVADDSRVPLSKLGEATAAIREREKSYSKVSWSLYNPIGQWFRSKTETVDYSKYPMRVASIEGMRRAVLLTVQLRSRGVPAEQAAEQLGTAELRNPFDGQPYVWDAKEQAVVFAASDGSPVSRHFYFY